MSFPRLPRAALQLSSQSSLKATRQTATTTPLFLRAASTPQCHRNATRSFVSSTSLQKKGGKANKSHASTDSSPPISKAGRGTPTDELLDLSILQADIMKAIEGLTHKLSQLRSGGRLNPEVVENLRVKIGTAGKDGDGKETVRLADIAQVVPRGRMLSVICGESEHIKHVSTAIAASPHSLTPLAPEASSPLTIQVPLPPPTGESRRAAVDAAGKAAESADKMIQKARQAHNQKIRKYSLERSVLPDDVQKASKRMEEAVKKGHTEVKRIVDSAKKVLDSI